MRKLSLRTCVVCRVIKPQNELIRLSLDKDGQVIIGKNSKKGGRGAYACNKDCLKQAVEENLLSRAFRRKVTA